MLDTPLRAIYSPFSSFNAFHIYVCEMQGNAHNNAQDIYLVYPIILELTNYYQFE